VTTDVIINCTGNDKTHNIKYKKHINSEYTKLKIIQLLTCKNCSFVRYTIQHNLFSIIT